MNHSPKEIDDAFEDWYHLSGQVDQFEDARAGWREGVKWAKEQEQLGQMTAPSLGGGLNQINFNQPDIPHKDPLALGYKADEIRELLKDDVEFMIERTEHFINTAFEIGYKSNDAGMSFKMGGLLALTSKFKQSLKEVFHVK